MTYNSLGFPLFFGISILIYLCMPSVKTRKWVILISNIVFYLLAGGWKMLLVLLASFGIVYACSLKIAHIYQGFEEEKLNKPELTPKEQTQLFSLYKKQSKKYLVAALILLLGFLSFVKIGKLIQVSGLLVPLGISYYTFSSIGYLLDVFWKKVSCEKNPLDLLLCMTFYPHIVQGPIGRYDKLMKQFRNLPAAEYNRVCFGLQRMLWGYLKKMVVADRLVLYTSAVFSDPAGYAGLEVVAAVLLCAVELYADFSGCMDIVCGIAQVMGVTLEENFNQPFFSKSAAEFWRRWHITLGAWFKDYVYMPLAMNPGFMQFTGKVRKKHGANAGKIVASAIPLAVVWILTGLWHGTGLDYILWGCYWGIIIITSTVLAQTYKKWLATLHIDAKSKWYQIFQMIRTYLLFCGGRMLTVVGCTTGAGILAKRILSGSGISAILSGHMFESGLDMPNFVVAILGVGIIWIVDILRNKMHIRETIAKWPAPVRWVIYYGAVIVLLIWGRYGSVYNAASFAYGAF